MFPDSQKQLDQIDSRSALEDIAHLTKKICFIWGTPELDIFLSGLLMDARDGARQGLPVMVATEILFLAKLNKMVRAMDLSTKLSLKVDEAYRLVDEGDQARLGMDPLDDPLVSRDTITRSIRTMEVPARRSGAPSAGDQAQGLGELLLMLFRSKLLPWAIILVLGLLYWPVFKKML